MEPLTAICGAIRSEAGRLSWEQVKPPGGQRWRRGVLLVFICKIENNCQRNDQNGRDN
jgi:hypothetical protein